MSLYYCSSRNEVRELDDETYNMWIEASHPRGALWVKLPEKPQYATHWNGTEWVVPPVEEFKTSKIAQIKQECTSILINKFGPGELWPFLDEAKPKIASMISASNVAIADIQAATDIDSVLAITASWPNLD